MIPVTQKLKTEREPIVVFVRRLVGHSIELSENSKKRLKCVNSSNYVIVGKFGFRTALLKNNSLISYVSNFTLLVTVIFRRS